MRRLTSLFFALALVASAADARQPGRVCLWEVTGGSATVYLLGSIHRLTADAYPLDPAIEAAFSAAREVVFEVDFGEAAAAGPGLFASGRLVAGRTLDELLPPELDGDLHRRLDDLGLEPGAVAGMKPWLAAITLSNSALDHAGLRAADGIDLTLYRRAVAGGKQVSALETAAEQVGLLDGLPVAQQVELLRQTLAELDTIEEEVARITALWKSGDAPGLDHLLSRSFRDTPEVYRALVTDRNVRWLPRIIELARGDHDVLVVVGVLHLVGKHGVIAGLQPKGLVVSQR